MVPEKCNDLLDWIPVFLIEIIIFIGWIKLYDKIK